MKRFRKLCVAAGLLAAGWAQGAGYEGFGATAGGDRFGVVKVTSLADKGPGTLREAVQKGGRRIVFTKSGTVTLKKTLKINQPNLTIDGLNAAITITGAPVAIDRHSVV